MNGTPTTHVALAGGCLVLCLAAGEACAAPRAVKPQEVSVKESSKDLLAGLNEHPDVVVEVTSGVEHYQKGRVTLVVHGDGTAEVVNARAGKEFRYPYRLAPDALKSFGAVMAAVGIDTLKSPPGPREPGDSPVVLRLLRGTRVLAEASVWYADRYEMPALDKVIDRTDALIKDATKGELPY